ncbi:MAG: hypothetical protein M3121_04920, partial [Chloroflexota bacterium]|nr:hypothetical protein [Chloroflexota bacterium]
MTDSEATSALNDRTLDTSVDALTRFRRARGFIFDMDGVLYRGGTRLPGVNDLFNALELRE